MNFIIRFFKKKLKKIIENKINDFEAEFITEANDRVDLPGLSEKEEEKVLKALYQQLIFIYENKQI